MRLDRELILFLIDKLEARLLKDLTYIPWEFKRLKYEIKSLLKVSNER